MLVRQWLVDLLPNGLALGPACSLLLICRQGLSIFLGLPMSLHYFGNSSLQIVNCYGFCRGPAWPQAMALTNSLLNTATQQLVIGRFGPRAICGDFNFSEGELDTFAVWQHHGWVSAQAFALRHWNQPTSPTCKGSAERDFIWLSPQTQCLCRQVQVLDIFQEHSTVAVDLSLDVPLSHTFRWPLPSRIPWAEVDLHAYHTDYHDVAATGTTTACYAHIGHQLETNLQGHVPTQPGRGLLPMQLGRCKRTAPDRRTEQPQFCRPSREGEVTLRCDATSHAVRAWFKQLRRLQSLRQSLTRGSGHWEAQLHRCELWSAILRARGFDGGFRHFWRRGYPDGHPHEPAELPDCLPTLAHIECIFATFHKRFEAFESWHIRQRCRLLKQKHDATMSGLYGELRKVPKLKPDLLWLDHYYTVLGMDAPTCALHLDRPLELAGRSTWTLNGCRIFVLDSEDDTCIVSHLPPLTPGDELHQHQVLSQIDEVHSAFVDFWRPRWNAYKDVSATDWARITTFAQAHMRALSLQLPPIDHDSWHRNLRRYKPTAARGVDGLSHLDLVNMPPQLVKQVLDLLDRVEGGEPWPQQTCFGVVEALAKVDGAHEVSTFRPIVVLSLLYRTWGSIRSRQLLARLTPHLPDGQIGFVPGQEAMNIWALGTAMVDLSCQGGVALCGLSSVLVRAFNCIPRTRATALVGILSWNP